MNTHTINLNPVMSSIAPDDDVRIVDGLFTMTVKGTEFLAVVRLIELEMNVVNTDASVKVEAIKLHRALTDSRYGLRVAKALVDAAMLYQAQR